VVARPDRDALPVEHLRDVVRVDALDVEGDETDSPVGRIPTETNYADYREVSGVKMPYRWSTIWLDGRETFELSDVRPNVPIDAAKFGRPSPPAAPPRRPAAP